MAARSNTHPSLTGKSGVADAAMTGAAATFSVNASTFSSLAGVSAP